MARLLISGIIPLAWILLATEAVLTDSNSRESQLAHLDLRHHRGRGRVGRPNEYSHGFRIR